MLVYFTVSVILSYFDTVGKKTEVIRHGSRSFIPCTLIQCVGNEALNGRAWMMFGGA